MLSVEARSAFIRGRSGLRLAASYYRACEPGGIGIGIADGGKPHFSDVGGLLFNLSHSGDHVMAVFSGDEMGFDIERPGGGGDFMAVARRFFREDEVASIERAGSGGRDLFLRIWTAKEAVLKLSGCGISGGLDRVGIDGLGRVTLDNRPVYLRHFSLGGLVGAVASFSPFEVKGWFEL
jgi:4'-phosphopantetheinyl transferase